MKGIRLSFNDFEFTYLPFLVASIRIKSADYERNHLLFEFELGYLECADVVKTLWEGHIDWGVTGNLRGAHS
jgi:hypothetical protein